ncbi:MAG TPA: hypothetical protein PK400_00045 [Phycisphaerales bacterium]|nr:hypothetical protein [Phycisphaerales bacterium]HRQ75192.1 hypothetical protein [Phycisphaerales bacterium]
MLGKLSRFSRNVGRCVLILFCLGMCLQAGCTASPLPSSSREARLADFASLRADAAAEAAQPAEATSSPAAASQADMAAAQTSTPPATAPTLGASSPSELRPGQRVIVDSLIGQINGQPIYAETVLAPLDDQLRAIRRRTNDREFETQVRSLLERYLQQLVRDELYLAQARAQLTTEERKGLFALMRHIREVEIAQGGGTRSGAEQRLREREGKGLDEAVESQRDAMLVTKLYRERIDSRVIVAWRDVQREYERRASEFNPPSKLKIARIRVENSNTTLRDEVTQRIASGEPFAAIAESLGQPEGRLWQEYDLGPEGIDGLQMQPILKEPLKQLGVGQTSEPFQVGSSTWWLHIVAIESPGSRSLYDLDVQQALHREIFARRRMQEDIRFLSSLLDEGIIAELTAMLERLVRIALVRYST